MKRVALVFVFLLAGEGAGAPPIETRVRESVVLQINGATAAYAIDESIATASGRDGLVTVFGKSAGTTRVMVVAFGRTVAYDVVVVAPVSMRTLSTTDAATSRRAMTEARYVSTTKQLQTTVDTAQAHAVLLRDREKTSIPAATIQVGKVTLLDKHVEETPLTSTPAAVRGVHFFGDGWRVHAGVTSSTFYDSFVLPVERRFVFGASRAWQLTPRWSVMPSIYASADRREHRGAIASLLAEYVDGDRLRARTELGFSRGFGGAVQLAANGEKSHLRADLRYQPRDFATIGVNDVRGFVGDLAASRSIGKLDVDAAATRTRTIFAGEGAGAPQSTATSTLDLRYHLVQRLTLIGGAAYGSFNSSIRNFNVPLGVAVNFARSSLSAVYRIGDNNTKGRTNGFRLSGATSIAGIHATAFIDRQDDAPTVAIFADRYPELASDLARAGITATSIGDIARLLQDASVLASLGLATAPRIDLALHRQQTGTDLAWRELRLRYVRNEAETVSARTTTTFTTLTWAHRLFGATDLEASYGLWTTDHHREPTYEIALRHRFDSLPSFSFGEISGSVYRDEDDARTPLVGVEVRLDDSRSTRTDDAGRYAFKNLRSSTHSVTAHLPAEDAYFTTPSHADAAVGEHVDFGIAFSPARLNVRVVDDTGRGVSGINVVVSGGAHPLSGASGTDGTAVFAMQPGRWIASIDEATLAAGYVIDGSDAKELVLQRAHSANVTFVVRANRSISGRIEGASARTAIDILPVNRRVFSDAAGNFAIRSLPAGEVTLHVRTRNAAATQSITLPAEPAVVNGVVLTPR